MNKLLAYATAINKAIGALLTAGVVTLLVGLDVIPDDIGTTITAVLTGAAAVLGAFLAPKNKPVPTAKHRAPDA